MDEKFDYRSEEQKRFDGDQNFEAAIAYFKDLSLKKGEFNDDNSFTVDVSTEDAMKFPFLWHWDEIEGGVFCALTVTISENKDAPIVIHFDPLHDGGFERAITSTYMIWAS